ELPEGLARRFACAEDLAAGSSPSVEASREQRDVGISQGSQAVDGDGVQPFAVVVHDDSRRAPRHAIADLELETSQGKRRREQRMRLRERTFLADVEQRDLATLDQRL